MDSLLAADNKAFLASLGGMDRFRARATALLRLAGRSYLRLLKTWLGQIGLFLTAYKAAGNASWVAGALGLAPGDGSLALGFFLYGACFHVAIVLATFALVGLVMLENPKKGRRTLSDNFYEIAFSGPGERARFERRLIGPSAKRAKPRSGRSRRL